MEREEARIAVRELIRYIGDDPDREGLLETPDRIIRSWEELFSGYTYADEDVEELLKTFEDPKIKGIVVLKDIDFYSMCEHHWLPFTGKVHIGYIPNGRIVGLSKLARVVEVYARRLQVQERLAAQIADAIYKWVRPRGVIVVVEAQHLCMVCRGVKKPNATMIVSEVRGVFEEREMEQKFLSLIKRS